jgi:hypothetical protein
MGIYFIRAPRGSALGDASDLHGVVHVHRVGRPRKEWIVEVSKCAVNLFGSMALVEVLAIQTRVWNAAVKSKLKATI